MGDGLGERQTLAEFAATQSIPLTRFAYLLCGDPHGAEDLVQGAFLALYRRFGDRLPVEAPVAYTRKSIVNAHLAAARRRSSSEIPVPELPEQATDPVDPTSGDMLWATVSRLPERQRAVLVMRYYLDLPDLVIAQTLGCRRGTVRSTASRALAALRHDPTGWQI